MTLKLENGVYPLDARGMPVEISGLEEALQNARLRLKLPKGTFPWGRELGSRLAGLDPSAEHADRQAVSLANEALLGQPGVRATAAEFPEEGGLRLTLTTPFGPGEILLEN